LINLQYYIGIRHINVIHKCVVSQRMLRKTPDYVTSEMGYVNKTPMLIGTVTLC